MHRTTRLSLMAAALSCTMSTPLLAQDVTLPADELAAMRAQLAAMNARIDQLEGELAATKAEAEARLFNVVEDTGADLVVLARYMQVLSDEACRELEGRCINIHHSFLPSFKGARPYHQAHARGVKVIGATAHYVTADLDEGPIITQVTETIDHTYTPADMIETGRHLEGTALLRAVKAHAEHRVFSHAGRTIVFAR